MVSETIILSGVSWSVIVPHKFLLAALSVYYLRGNAFLVSSGAGLLVHEGHCPWFAFDDSDRCMYNFVAASPQIKPLTGHTAGNVTNQTESQLRFWSLISVESVLMFNSHCQLISKLLLQPLALRFQ